MGVYLRGETWWVSYISSEGRHKRESTKCADKKEAEAIFHRMKADVLEGKEKRKNKLMKFEEFGDKYLKNYAMVQNRSWKKSDQVYIGSLKKFFSGYYLSAINQDAIREFMSKKKSEGTQNGGINRILACLKSMFNRAIEWGDFVGINPMKLIKKLDEPPGRIKFLEKEDLIRLVECCEEKFKPYVLISVHTGLRLSEQMGLKWDDVDSKNNNVHVYRTKSGKMRTFKMNDDVRKVFQNIPRQADSPYIFCDKDGKSNVNVRGAFDRAKEKSKITDFHWHDLRHTTASHLAMKGVDMYSIKEYLGHCTIAMTQRYAHLSEAHQEKVVSALNGLTGNINRHNKASDGKQGKSPNRKSVTKSVTISQN